MDDACGTVATFNSRPRRMEILRIISDVAETPFAQFYYTSRTVADHVIFYTCEAEIFVVVMILVLGGL